MPLTFTRNGERVWLGIIIPLILGIMAAWLIGSANAPDSGMRYPMAYVAVLQDAWKVTAAWLPLMAVLLTLIVSNSDKELVARASQHGITDTVITDIAICTGLVFIVTILLFMFNFFADSAAMVFSCTVALFVLMGNFMLLFRFMFLLARAIAKMEGMKKATDK